VRRVEDQLAERLRLVLQGVPPVRRRQLAVDRRQFVVDRRHDLRRAGT
jgi:hypothetical protein